MQGVRYLSVCFVLISQKQNPRSVDFPRWMLAGLDELEQELLFVLSEIDNICLVHLCPR
jgi:hypothetical protein